MTVSAIYEGEVLHRRLGPTPHRFRQRMFAMYLDLEELPSVFRGRWLWSSGAFNLVHYRRADYLGSPERPLREAVLDRVEEQLGRRPAGAVRMLTQLRTLGYVFNPVTFYYCHDDSGAVDAVVAEITNTPWRERHAYVLDARAAGSGRQMRWTFDKAFHVSPFLDMNHVYEWSFSQPGETLDVHMTNREAGRSVFHAHFTGRRRPITGRNLARMLVRYPLLPLRLHLAIYWQAARLYLKRAAFFPHPDKRSIVRSGDTA